MSKYTTVRDKHRVATGPKYATVRDKDRVATCQNRQHLEIRTELQPVKIGNI